MPDEFSNFAAVRAGLLIDTSSYGTQVTTEEFSITINDICDSLVFSEIVDFPTEIYLNEPTTFTPEVSLTYNDSTVDEDGTPFSEMCDPVYLIYAPEELVSEFATYESCVPFSVKVNF